MSSLYHIEWRKYCAKQTRAQVQIIQMMRYMPYKLATRTKFSLQIKQKSDDFCLNRRNLNLYYLTLYVRCYFQFAIFLLPPPLLPHHQHILIAYWHNGQLNPNVSVEVGVGIGACMIPCVKCNTHINLKCKILHLPLFSTGKLKSGTKISQIQH